MEKATQSAACDSTVRTITVSATVLRDTTGRVLHVRKRDTHMFMLPGGKPDAGESFLECARREVREELGLELAADQLSELGVFTTRAANEAGFSLVAHVFVASVLLSGTPSAQAEIAEVMWFDPAADDSRIAPLSLEHVLPLLANAPGRTAQQT